MVHCRNWELVRARPCRGISPGGNLAVLQQSGGQGRSIPRALCLLFEGLCTFSLASEEAGQDGASGMVCPEQPQTCCGVWVPHFPLQGSREIPKTCQEGNRAGVCDYAWDCAQAGNSSCFSLEAKGFLSPHFPLLWASSCSHLAPATLFRHH